MDTFLFNLEPILTALTLLPYLKDLVILVIEEFLSLPYIISETNPEFEDKELKLYCILNLLSWCLLFTIGTEDFVWWLNLAPIYGPVEYA